MLESCIKIDTSYTPAYLLMAKLHDVDGRKKMVGQLLRQVVQLHPENPDHLAEYAGWLYDQGNGRILTENNRSRNWFGKLNFDL